MAPIAKTEQAAINYCKMELENQDAVNINPTKNGCESVVCDCGETPCVDLSGVNNGNLISVKCGYCETCGTF